MPSAEAHIYGFRYLKKCVFRVCFESRFKRMIPSLKYKCPPRISSQLIKWLLISLATTKYTCLVHMAKISNQTYINEQFQYTSTPKMFAKISHKARRLSSGFLKQGFFFVLFFFYFSNAVNLFRKPLLCSATQSKDRPFTNFEE